MVQDHAGAVRDEFVGRTKAPRHADGQHTRRGRGAHVDARVAQVGDPRRRHAEAIADEQGRGGVGLERPARPRAHDLRERAAVEEGGDDAPRQLVGLVRKHGQPDAVGAQGARELGDAIVQAGLVEAVLPVFGDHLFETRGDRRLGPLLAGEGLTDQVVQPLTDHERIRGRTVDGQAPPAQDPVHGVGYVLVGIGQRAVQVKNRRLELHRKDRRIALHRAPFVPALPQMCRVYTTGNTSVRSQLATQFATARVRRAPGSPASPSTATRSRRRPPTPPAAKVVV